MGHLFRRLNKFAAARVRGEKWDFRARFICNYQAHREARNGGCNDRRSLLPAQIFYPRYAETLRARGGGVNAKLTVKLGKINTSPAVPIRGRVFTIPVDPMNFAGQ